jgi:hypothetical protein
MTDPVTKAYEARCKRAEDIIAIMREALNFYANRNHWMGISEQSEMQMLLVSHGNNEAFAVSSDGWSMADWALAKTAK